MLNNAVIHPTEGMLFPVLLGLALGLVGAFPSPQDDAAPGKNWVVIVAGSNGWYNYRHQVRKHGNCSLNITLPSSNPT